MFKQTRAKLREYFVNIDEKAAKNMSIKSQYYKLRRAVSPKPSFVKRVASPNNVKNCTNILDATTGVLLKFHKTPVTRFDVIL